MSTTAELYPPESTIAGIEVAHPAAVPTLVIEPASRWPRIDVRELWAYRGLFLFLVWRDVKVKYAQTVMGVGWAVLQPVLTMVVFTVIFGRFAKIPSDGVPYSVFSLAAMVPWTYFSTALSGASNSLVSSTNLITKVYFPRLVIPFAPVLAGLVDFGIGFAILLCFMLAYGIVPGLSALVLVPTLLLATMLTAAGMGCWLSALNIQYRDVKYVIPFLVQVWMYASPIVYPMSMVPEKYRAIYALNPMAGVVEGFRSALLGTNAVAWSTIGVSLTAGLVLFLSGAAYFRRTERIFADVA
ncbi:MAG TPA: ABC transporter permease [Longimicrobiaceae bacterium]|nr:ABC transporter permease [Longimicrobiaceae bacterium]